MGSVTPGYSAISSESRVQILHALQNRPLLTIDDLVTTTSLHANTVREHLQRLTDEGYIVCEAEPRATRGRPRTLYSVATGVPPASSPIARRKVREAADRGDLMRRVMPQTDDGELSTEELHQVDAIVENLLDAGFDPVVDPEDLSINLSPCTHLHASGGVPGMRCSVHINLLQSVVAEAGGPLSVEGLRTGCNPQDCVIQLKRSPEAP